MKFLIKIIIILFWFFCFLGISFANSQFINKLNVFEEYLENKKSNIEIIIKKYNFKNTNILKDTNEMLDIIKKIKKWNYNNEKQKIILNSIIWKIKTLNYDISKNLKKEISNYNKKLKEKKQYYINISDKLEIILNKIILSIYKKRFQNKEITQKNKNLANILLKIKNDIKKLENFKKMEFRTEKWMKDIFNNILKSIKDNLINLKNNL